MTANSQQRVPQTPITMEACMILASGPEDQFWQAQERMGPIVAAQPGFRAVIGGPIAASGWMYFCGKFDSASDMDAWYDSRRHKPVMDKAHTTWFDAFYIRKWRELEAGEQLAGPLFNETAIVPAEALPAERVDALVDSLREAMTRHGALPFETLAGEYEGQPFQFVGPLEEFPVVAPVRYLLVSHWSGPEALDKWLSSPEYAALAELGEVTTETLVQVVHDAGEREGLKADGSQRGWSRAASGG
ncbi:hypothetical protein [Pseudonocardia sp.]|jgi:antibiotic biosynthesis monooxygenase (ABM) superfamily enzyme|uniref:hypothetical protein n=1 Tax=Pseudonocardia sp. TaxID=60912 RepID=UPI003D1258E7